MAKRNANETMIDDDLLDQFIAHDPNRSMAEGVEYIRLPSFGLTITPKVATGLIGLPGIGKTAAVEGLRRKDFPVAVITLSLCQSGEAGGVYWVQETRDGIPCAQRALPDYFKMIRDAGTGIIMFDELTTATPTIRASALRIIASRAIENVFLPPKAYILAAWNESKDVDFCHDLDPAMANRLRHHHVRLEYAKWVDGVANNFGQPVECSRVEREMQLKVAAFTKATGGKFLHNFPTDISKRQGPWPSPRSWMNAAAQWAADHVANHKDSARCVQGLTEIVGSEAGQQFAVWMQQNDLPDPAEIIEDVSKYTPPKNRPDLLYAIFGSLVACATEMRDTKKLTERHFHNAARIMLDKSMNPQFTDLAFSFGKPLLALRERRWKIPSEYMTSVRAMIEKSIQ
jgi:hypothetical protein